MMLEINTKLLPIKEQIYNIIKDNILNGTFKPGQRLQELEIAAQFNVSRSPVREVLKELVGEGILEDIPNKGVYVRKLDKKYMQDIYEIRELIEKYSIKKAISKLCPEDIKKLDEIYNSLEESFSMHDINEYARIDTELHNFIVYLSGNNFAYHIVEKGFALLQPFRTISLHDKNRFEESLIEHKNIIEGIKEKNFEKAWQWASKHLILAKNQVFKYIDSTSETEI